MNRRGENQHLLLVPIRADNNMVEEEKGGDGWRWGRQVETGGDGWIWGETGGDRWRRTEKGGAGINVFD